MTTQTETKRPTWLVWLRVGLIIAALGFAFALYGSISQTHAPLLIGRGVMITGLVGAAVAGIWRLAAGRR